MTVLKNVAVNLKKDKKAIHNAMKYYWNNGQLAGQVNRLKTIKRQMAGLISICLEQACSTVVLDASKMVKNLFLGSLLASTTYSCKSSEYPLIL